MSGPNFYRLLGDAVAGSAGNKSAVVTAGDLQPSKLRIADVTAKPAYWGKTGSIYGQMAYISVDSDNPDEGSRSANASTQETQMERIPGSAERRRSGADAWEKGHDIKVVPLARPYLSFGPASTQLLREQSEMQLYASDALCLDSSRKMDVLIGAKVSVVTICREPFQVEQE